MECPNCQGQHVVKNGHIHNGKQNHICRDCKRKFVVDPKKQPISDQKKQFIDKLLLERVPIAGIARVVSVSESWLQSYVNHKYEQQPEIIEVNKKKGLLQFNAMKCGLL